MDILNSVLETLAMGLTAIVLLFLSVYLMERITPFSIKKEIEEDHNLAAGILCGSVVIGVAMVIAAVSQG